MKPSSASWIAGSNSRAPGQSAVVEMRRLDHAQEARHPDRETAGCGIEEGQRLAGGIQEEVGRGGGGRRLESVIGGDPPRVLVEIQ